MKPKNVLVLLGSVNDWKKVKHIFETLEWGLSIEVKAFSCHFHPAKIRKLGQLIAYADAKTYDLVICVGGLALALPGILDAWIRFYGGFVPVAGVALGEPGTRELLAAQYSIEYIPNNPLVLTPEGHAYTGPDGLQWLLESFQLGNLSIVLKERPDKPFGEDIWHNCPDDEVLRLPEE